MPTGIRRTKTLVKMYLKFSNCLPIVASYASSEIPTLARHTAIYINTFRLVPPVSNVTKIKMTVGYETFFNSKHGNATCALIATMVQQRCIN